MQYALLLLFRKGQHIEDDATTCDVNIILSYAAMNCIAGIM